MKNQDFLKTGVEVRLQLVNEEEIIGRIIKRYGIGEENNFIPSQEIITVKNSDQEVNVSLSNIRDAKKIEKR